MILNQLLLAIPAACLRVEEIPTENRGCGFSEQNEGILNSAFGILAAYDSNISE